MKIKLFKLLQSLRSSTGEDGDRKAYVRKFPHVERQRYDRPLRKIKISFVCEAMLPGSGKP